MASHRRLLKSLLCLLVVGSSLPCAKGWAEEQPAAPDQGITVEKFIEQELAGVELGEPDQRPVSLRYRPVAGKRYRLTMEADQDIVQQPGGRSVQMAQKIGMGLLFHVQAVDREGNASIKVTYDRMRLEQEGPMGKVAYDSAKPDRPVPVLARGLAALVGGGFGMKLSSAGEALEITGLQQMVDKVIGNLDVPAGPTRDALIQGLKRQISEQALKDTINQAVAFYPKGDVKIGDKWTSRMAISAGFPVVLDNTYELVGRPDGVAVITVKSRVSVNPDAEPMAVGPVKMTFHLSGTQGGVAQVDLATGFLGTTKLRQNFSGEASMDGAPGMAAAQSWPMRITSEQTMEWSEVKD